MKRKCRKCGYLGLRAAPGAATAAPALAVQQPEQHRLEVHRAAHHHHHLHHRRHHVPVDTDGGYDDYHVDDATDNDASIGAVRLSRLNDLPVCASVAAAATLDAAPVSCASTAP